jgi:hypothetical protein
VKKCVKCGRKHDGEKSHCQRCVEALRQRTEKLKAAGICTSSGCGKPAEPGRVLCHAHLAYHRNLRARKRREGKAGPTLYENCTSPLIKLLNDYDAIL